MKDQTMFQIAYSAFCIKAPQKLCIKIFKKLIWMTTIGIPSLIVLSTICLGMYKSK